MEGRIYTLSVYRLGHGVTQLTPYAPYLAPLLSRSSWRRHELRTDWVGNRLPDNFINSFQRSRIQFPARDIRNRRQLRRDGALPKAPR